jgi:predicted metal-binding membrane protein
MVPPEGRVFGRLGNRRIMTYIISLASNFEPPIYRGVASHRAFAGVCALLFVTSAALTISWCGPMTAMQGMPMPGGWTMSMAWMRMPGQTWIQATASFLAMWIVMMAAMMLPSLAPMLWRYKSRFGLLTLLVGLAYFFVWTLVGFALFPLGVVLGAVEMGQPALARIVPFAVGVVILIAGAVQLTSWKAHHLACCRETKEDAGTAWRQGLRFGFHCVLSCANLTAILVVIGVMDLRAMAVVTAAIIAERLAPAGVRVSQAIGALVVAAGLLLIARATGLA